MKKLLAISIAIMCGVLSAAESPVVATTLLADGSTNTWTQADLQAALGLMNRMYHRDMGTDAGRAKWHGDRRPTAPSARVSPSSPIPKRRRRPQPRRSAAPTRRAPRGNRRTFRPTSPHSAPCSGWQPPPRPSRSSRR